MLISCFDCFGCNVWHDTLIGHAMASGTTTFFKIVERDGYLLRQLAKLSSARKIGQVDWGPADISRIQTTILPRQAT